MGKSLFLILVGQIIIIKTNIAMSKKTVVCEYVGFGHPDVVADMVSDALLD